MNIAQLIGAEVLERNIHTEVDSNAEFIKKWSVFYNLIKSQLKKGCYLLSTEIPLWIWI